MKNQIMKSMFIVCLTLTLVFTPITANASTKKSEKKNVFVPAPSRTCSVEANEMNGFGVEALISPNSNKTSTNGAKEKIKYHTKISPYFGTVSGATITLTCYCTKSKNKIAAKFKNEFNFVKTNDKTVTISAPKALKSSSSADVVESESTDDVIKYVFTNTVCSKKGFETKTLYNYSDNPHN